MDQVDVAKQSPHPALGPVMKARGVSHADLAEKAKTSRQQIGRLINGKRDLTMEWAERLAPHLKVRAIDLYSPPKDIETILSVNNSITTLAISQKPLIVVGHVRAGNWIEATDSQDIPLKTLPISEHPDYTGFRQYAFEVIGDSMDRVFDHGSFAICVDAFELGKEPKSGDIVVARRTMNQGQLEEYTLKRIRANGDSLELWPESHNPAHSDPVVLGTNKDHTVVQIHSYVIGMYKDIRI